jgi:HD superfamily phosphohydrolase YqeK
MQEPWTGIISNPSNHHLLVYDSSRSYIPAYGVDVVESAVASALHDVKVMLP